jgi:hypothetical protein
MLIVLNAPLKASFSVTSAADIVPIEHSVSLIALGGMVVLHLCNLERQNIKYLQY